MAGKSNISRYFAVIYMRLPCFLHKPSGLTEPEFAIMKTHTIKGGEIIDMMVSNLGLFGLPHVEILRNIALYHHETIDGNGYAGLKHDEIPELSPSQMCLMHLPVSDLTKRRGVSIRSLRICRKWRAANSIATVSRHWLNAEKMLKKFKISSKKILSVNR